MIYVSFKQVGEVLLGIMDPLVSEYRTVIMQLQSVARSEEVVRALSVVEGDLHSCCLQIT